LDPGTLAGAGCAIDIFSLNAVRCLRHWNPPSNRGKRETDAWRVGFPDPRLGNETRAGLHIIIKRAENEGDEEARKCFISRLMARIYSRKKSGRQEIFEKSLK
jgi:hypothetical protein